MCSVVGYVGKSLSRAYVMEGLARLEYRGYDSAGFACVTARDKQLLSVKAKGGIQQLQKKCDTFPIDGYLGIGHTRWSTHGVVSEDNAHPHFDCQQTISIVHNGIIENYHELRAFLLQNGHQFRSDTDTEVIAHLFETLITTHQTFKAAIVDLVNQLKGAYAFIGMLQEFPDTLVVVRKRSPLCIGIGDGEMFIASDVLAFAGRTTKALYLPDESFALVRQDMIELYSFDGKPLPLAVQQVENSWQEYGKQGYEHFMLKEIYEQKKVLYDTVDFCSSLYSSFWERSGITADFIKQLRSITIVACGTSAHAGKIARYFLEKLIGIPVAVELASEFRHQELFIDPQGLYIFISQSGETADTLEALRLLAAHGAKTFALTNTAASTIVRESEGFFLTQAGKEISVASTKAFTAQVAALYWFAHRVAAEKGRMGPAQVSAAQDELLLVAEVLENSIEQYKRVIGQQLAPYYAQFKRFIFLGRHISYPFAQEAALKLKEVAYLFVDSYPAGELKHGPLALVDSQTPVVLFSVGEQEIYEKLLINAQAIKSRQGHLLVFAYEDQKELIALADNAFVFPRVPALLTPLAMTGLMQYFTYEIAKVLERPIDKPRNLAKSVTVE